jgi:glyoxylase-like metal-dependent hydrolase (beta-lactamase superfamily II)
MSQPTLPADRQKGTAMTNWRYTKGLHDIGRGCYAYLQPDGSWGWSNAGLIVDGEKTLLVDTLFDLRLTREMLDEMRDAVPAARAIDVLVNTHANGDHTFGNQLVNGAQIIATRATADEMAERPPSHLAELVNNRRQLGPGAEFLYEVMGKNFKFDDVVYTPPTRTFEDRLTLKVGDKAVELLHVGPAHTRGDTLIYVPQDRIAFAGDIMFVGGHPVIWAGPVENWIAACDTILGWDVDVIVPGHGPITDKSGVARFKGYLEYIRDETRQRYDAGLSYYDAASEIALDPYADWLDPERIVINVASLYHQFGMQEKPAPLQLWADMARYHKARQSACGHDHDHSR